MGKRLAVIDSALCKPSQCGHECVSVCPVNKLNQECVIIKEDAEEKIASIAAPLCTGCGMCVRKCPFHAISVVNLVAPVEEKLIFSYGENSFKLYGFALPMKGVIGVLGDNGCGKTTNVKLIEGKIKPQKKYSKEVEAFFSNMPSSIIKPQEIKSAKLGKVSDLLKKAGPRMNELRKVFDLDSLAGRKFDQLSGGELQRAYVAFALSKETEVFVLDEPFAFLDYAYRIRLVEYLRKEFSEKSVLLVDHDLSLLSYACDNAYIIFGEPGVYGIVSQPYATDRAINQFIEGFLDGENVRFREEPLKFKRQTPEKKTDPATVLPADAVERGSFKVENPEDITLYRGEIVGIVGRNGIGKSTLVQHYADMLDAPIKPQLLERGSDLVLDVLSSDTPFKQRFVNEMNLKKLEFLSLEQLSGGELQKVEIFRALAEKQGQGMLFVLDEPTNMMDVKGRVALSRLLREKAKEGCAVLVVDHDLEFVLNTVDRLVVLEGTPAVQGRVAGVFSKEKGISRLLSDFDLTYRRDQDIDRLKLNKAGSVKHRALKESGKFVE
ncbi:ATP-binding cassette domain-containing protein [Candidatus Micrarchaeota archaeon]|nr:ATP-binding cassette domain-containing protein [Candidatus Micrarchaeota archaeon]